jgi:hypothetical protein
MSSKKVDMIVEAFRRWRDTQHLLEGAKPFVIYRVSTGVILKRGVYGYENAIEASKRIRKELKLKFEDVKFKVDKSAPSPYKRVDYAPTVNPSKGRRFRGYYTSSGEYHDID